MRDRRARASREPSVSEVSEAVDYLLRPRLLVHGGDVWVDSVLEDRLVLGVSIKRSRGELTLAWVRAMMEQLWPGAADRIELKDYSSDAVGP